MRLKKCGLLLIICGVITFSLYFAEAFSNSAWWWCANKLCSGWIWSVKFSDLIGMIGDLNMGYRYPMMSWVGLFYLLSIFVSCVLIAFGLIFFIKPAQALLKNKIFRLITLIFFCTFFMTALTINLWTIFSGVPFSFFFIIYILVEIVTIAVLSYSYIKIEQFIKSNTKC